MSLLRTVLRQACNQYSCLLATRNAGGLITSQASYVDRRGDDAKFSKQKEMQFDYEGKDLSTPTPIQQQIDKVRPNDLRPGYGNVPTADIYDKTYNGVRYDQLPTIHITCTRNNTKAYATHGPNGELVVTQRTGGSVGFKNAKKSSNVAAQTVGLTIAQVMVKKKMQDVRVTLSGTGIHRMTALRGLVLGGVNIVSISDRTYPTFDQRPPKPRRI